jgi:adenylosuccinate synthase
MPLKVVVGGQFGSEGKGKVALDIARREKAAAVVRTGGTNSGHTAVVGGVTYALRQLPAAALATDALVVMPAGALIDPEIFREEVELLGLGADRVKVDRYATVILTEDKLAEQQSGLVDKIGSTGSGTGAALQRRISRRSSVPVQAAQCPALEHYLCDTTSTLRRILNCEGLVVIEGTQGFGLSLLHGGFYPKATSRDTTAAAFVAEAGLSPLDVSGVVLVIRSFPIRVAGDSGPLASETTWEEVAASAGLPPDFRERTTVTKKVRRVGRFDAEIVRRAIAVNNPSEVVLNHLDYVEPAVRHGHFTSKAVEFVAGLESEIDRKVDWVGTDPSRLVPRKDVALSRSGSQALAHGNEFEMAAPAAL